MIIISPLGVVKKLVNERDVGCVVGLLAGENEHPELPVLAVNGNHLKLTMHDIASPVKGMTPPGVAQVEQLIDFVHRWDRKKPMLIHCWAGVSRSTASAFIAQCTLNPHISEQELAQELRALSPTATPNPLIISYADKLLKREGRMLDAVESIGRGANAFEGNVFDWPV